MEITHGVDLSIVRHPGCLVFLITVICTKKGASDNYV